MDRIQYGSSLLKIVIVVQIIFSSWGYLEPPGGGFMPTTYGFTHLILLLFAALSVVKPNSADAVLMYLFINLFTILNDIMLLGLYQPFFNDVYERNLAVRTSTLNTYRFALGMVIVNLILKPLVCFILYKIYLNRGGDLRSELVSITVTGNGRSYNGYDNMEDSNNIETASPHQSIDHTSHSG